MTTPFRDPAHDFVTWVEAEFLTAVAETVGATGARDVTVSLMAPGMAGRNAAAALLGMSPSGDVAEAIRALGDDPDEPSLSLMIPIPQARLGGVFRQGGSPGLAPEMRTTLLKMVGEGFLTLTHEAIHLGSYREAKFAAMQADHQRPGAVAATEAFVTVCAERAYLDVLRRAGLLQIDPDLAGADLSESIEATYLGPAHMVRKLVDSMALQSGLTDRQLLDPVAVHGADPKSLAALLGRYLTAVKARHGEREVAYLTDRLLFTIDHVDDHMRMLGPIGQLTRDEAMMNRNMLRLAEAGRNAGARFMEELAGVAARGIPADPPELADIDLEGKAILERAMMAQMFRQFEQMIGSQVGQEGASREGWAFIPGIEAVPDRADSRMGLEADGRGPGSAMHQARPASGDGSRATSALRHLANTPAASPGGAQQSAPAHAEPRSRPEPSGPTGELS